MTTYAEKLRDPRWQRRRLEIMQRNDFCCESCGDSERTLNVHHKRYFKGRDPWDYADRWLVSLCERCHSYEHEMRDEIEDLLASVAPFRMSWYCLHAVVLALVADLEPMEHDDIVHRVRKVDGYGPLFAGVFVAIRQERKRYRAALRDQSEAA